LNFRELGRIVQSYFGLILTLTSDIPMFARFPLQASSSRDTGLSRLAEWWPAALIGLLALLGGIPDSNAQTLLGLL
jgi:hypothetical protein